MSELIERVIKGLEERRNNIINGNINSIPSPFKRFSNDFVGIEHIRHIVLLGDIFYDELADIIAQSNRALFLKLNLRCFY